MAFQRKFDIATRRRGMHEITAHVAEVVRDSGIRCGLAHVFAAHTSCSIFVTENADSSVRRDLETLAQRWAPDADPSYLHDTEGPDDMAAHARAALAGVSVSVPVAESALVLGAWQGIFLWEHRTQPHVRSIFVTVLE